MAETAKKFLDLTGLTYYNDKIKSHITTEISKIDTAIRTDHKVKDVDTTDNDKVSLTLVDGKVGVTVDAAVVKDSGYSTVKANANNSAAAWDKFLEGITDLYPDSVAPALKDLATKTETNNALTEANSYADGLAKNYDKVGAAAQALLDANSYADGLVKDAEGNVKFDAKGSAEAAKTAAISEANAHTDGEIKKVNDAITSINTSIAGGVHFIGISSSVITDKGTETPTIDGWTGPVKTGDIVINGAGAEFIWDGSVWQKLGDTTAEQERLTSLEGHVNTLIGDENKAGSVKKALKDAKDYADGKIDTLVGPTGQVGKNTAAIAVLNGADTVEGSVDYKIAQAVSNIEASIDTIPESDINSLFSK